MIQIEQIPLEVGGLEKRAEEFLAANGLAPEPLDYFAVLTDGDKILACGGFEKNVIKCVATSPEARDMQLSNKIVSHLRSELKSRGASDIFVFTKRSNREIFASLAFHPIAQSDDAVLLESSARGVSSFCEKLSAFACDGKNGCIVMNANPFTLGHRYLAEAAARSCDRLHVIAVREDASEFPFALRLEMIKAGLKHLPDAVVHEGGDYVISKATFPAYFLKDSGMVSKNQAQLDADLFSRHIAPALKICERFVGSEPLDAVTNAYNSALRQILPSRGIKVTELARMEKDGAPVSAKRVRALLKEKKFAEASRLVPDTTAKILSANGMLE